MTAAIQLKKAPKQTQTTSQKTFQRLKKKIEQLHAELAQEQRTLDGYVTLHREKIDPLKLQVTTLLQQLLKALYAHYKKPDFLKKQEREALRGLLHSKSREILDDFEENVLDPEIAQMYQEMSGESFDTTSSKELDSLREAMQEMFDRETDLNIDFSNIEMTFDESELLRRIGKAVQEAETTAQNRQSEKPKSKKEQARLKKTAEIEALQKQEIGSVYKRLAKTFHPDLEQDPQEKLAKEQLMKQLTGAYDSNDIHTLLVLEMQWLSRAENAGVLKSEEQLKIYNSLLKEQVAELEQQLTVSIMHPKYHQLRPYIEEYMQIGEEIFYITLSQLRADILLYTDALKRLENSDQKKAVQSIVHDWMRDTAFNELF